MVFARILLAVTAGIFLLFGLIYMVVPDLFLAPVGITAPPEGMADLRATYGGVQIGIAAFLLWSIRTKDWSRVCCGLYATLFIVGAISLCRVIGLEIADSTSNFHLAAFGFEIPIILLSYIAIKRGNV